MNSIDLQSLLNTTTSSTFAGSELFGHASTKKSLADVLALLKEVVDDGARSAAAAYGMLLCAKLSDSGPYRDDVLLALDRLAFAKALIDQAVCHTFPVANVTSDVLQAAQRFADEATIPCTEWPSVEEVQAAVFKACAQYSKVDQWRLAKLNAHGAMVGVYLAPFP